MPTVHGIISLLAIALGTLFLIISVSTMDWYSIEAQAGNATHTLKLGLFRQCLTIQQPGAASAEQCKNILADLQGHYEIENAYNKCYMSADKAASHIRTAQAFGILGVLFAVGLTAMGLVCFFIKPGPASVPPIFAGLVFLCTLVTTCTYYSATHCFMASSNSGAGSSVALLWIGTILLTVGGGVMFFKPMNEDGKDAPAYSSI